MIEQDEIEPTASTPRWISYLSVVLVCLMVGGAAGFIIGDKKGKSFNAQEVTHANALTNEAERRLKDAETEQAKGKIDSERSLKQLRTVARDYDDKSKTETQAKLEVAVLTSKVAELTLRLQQYATYLASLEEKFKLSKQQADILAKELAEKVANQRGAQLDLYDKRAKASDAAQVRLNEYELISDAKERPTIHSAIITLRNISLDHNDGKKYDLSTIRASIARECAQIIRVGGDAIPNGSKFTLTESWNYALGGK